MRALCHTCCLFGLTLLTTLTVSAELGQSPLQGFDDLPEATRYQTLTSLMGRHQSKCEDGFAGDLIDATKDTSYRVRNMAVLLLAGCKSTSVADAAALRLLEMLQSNDERSEVKGSVIVTLGGMGQLTSAIKAVLLDYAENSNTSIRREDATLALASFEAADPEILGAVHRLLEASRKSSAVVAVRCYRLMANDINSQPAVAADVIRRVQAKLPSTNVDFSQSAAYLFADLKSHAMLSVPTMIEMLQKSPFSHKAVATSLMQIGAAAKPALPALKKAASTSSGFDKKTLEQAIAELEKI